MKCKFLHLSDVHLGYQQYNHPERFNDFGRAFLHIVEQAIAERVQFVVLGGDLFQKRAIDPPTLVQAMAGLGRLKEAGIPVAAVEGNHEHAHYRDVFSWMEFLADRGYLALLNPTLQESKVILTPWDGVQGAYLDLAGGIRIYGVKYYGASTARVVEGLIEALASAPSHDREYVILMLHAGLEGVLPHYSALLTHSQLAPLRPYVDYLALGHIHKPFEYEDWIYNPGSPETCSVDEAAWPGRGYYLVEVDTGQTPKHSARLIRNPRRAFVRLALNVDTCASPAALYAAVERRIKDEASQHSPPAGTDAAQPVVELALEGVLPFHHHELDVKRLEAIVRAGLDPLLVRIANRSLPAEYEVGGDQVKPRAELEREVVEDLVERDARYRPSAAAWTDVILEVKRLVLEGSAPAGIAEYLEAAAQQVGWPPG